MEQRAPFVWPCAAPEPGSSSRRNVVVDTRYDIRYFSAHHARDTIACNFLPRRDAEFGVLDAVFGVLKVGDASGPGANGQQS